MPVEKRLGLIAGAGRFPVYVADHARQEGTELVCLLIEGLAEPEIRDLVASVHPVKVGALGEMINIFKRESVDQAVMAGKTPKTLIYENPSDTGLDEVGIELLRRVHDKRDDSILGAIVEAFARQGIEIIAPSDYLKPLFVEKGCLTAKQPQQPEESDIEFGWKMAKEIGRLDIGQTVVVKSRAVLAVESIEGTDEAIRRGGRLGGEGAVVVKVAKLHQDMRFDLPVVGLETVKAMEEVGARVLALEAGIVLMIDRDDTIAFADQSGIVIVAR